jgi:hypothetical protein
VKSKRKKKKKKREKKKNWALTWSKPNQFFWAFKLQGPGPVGPDIRQLKAQAQIDLHKPNPIWAPMNPKPN